ncbi:MAG: hypothetical protein HRU03_00600 [Nanoarchaeales archaeon]|nr:hypothetical protein [Nanoarchaeales archaeon]
MTKLYFFRALVAFVTSLVGIFVPVYLYHNNFSIILILLYAIGISSTYIITAPLVISIINKIGLKYTLLLSTPFYIIYLISLQYITQNMLFFHILWLSQGIYMSLFWISFKAEVIMNSSRENRTKQIGTLQTIVVLLTAVAPIIGGVFLEYVSYWNLLIIGTFLLILSNVPLMISEDIKLLKIKFKHSDYIDLIRKKTNKQSKISHVAEGVELLLSTFIWPIIIFVFVKENFAVLGLLYTIISLITVVALFKVKKYIDKISKKKVLEKASKMLSISWYLRAILTIFGSVFLFLIETFANLITNIVTITLTSIFYNNTNSQNFMRALLTRTIYMHGTKIILSIILIIILLMIEENFSNLTIILFIGMVSSIGLNSIVENEIY